METVSFRCALCLGAHECLLDCPALSEQERVEKPAPEASDAVRAGTRLGFKLAEKMGYGISGKVAGGLLGGLLAAWLEDEAKKGK